MKIVTFNTLLSVRKNVFPLSIRLLIYLFIGFLFLFRNFISSSDELLLEHKSHEISVSSEVYKCMKFLEKRLNRFFISGFVIINEISPIVDPE